MDRRAVGSDGRAQQNGSSRPNIPIKGRVWINSKFRAQQIVDSLASTVARQSDEAAKPKPARGEEVTQQENPAANKPEFDNNGFNNLGFGHEPWQKQSEDRRSTAEERQKLIGDFAASMKLDETPGSSGLQQWQQEQTIPAKKPSALVKKPKKGWKPQDPAISEAAQAVPDEKTTTTEGSKSFDAANASLNQDGTETAPYEPIGKGFNHLPLHVTTRISHHFLNSMPKNMTQLGPDFATLMQAMAYNGHAAKFIGQIHTAAVMRDYLILLRGDNINDAYIFEWKRRSSFIALKMLATLRENGFWTCRCIKVYDTSPMPPKFPNVPRSRTQATDAVMHDHLAQLLTRFGATEEVKLAECPFFWGIKGISSLRQLTTSLHSTLAIRGIPDATWMPGGNWSGIHALPRLLRRSDALSFISTELDAQTVQRMQARTTHWSSYAEGAKLPSNNFIDPRRRTTTTAEAAMPTFQISAWKLQRLIEQLYQDVIPQGFERIDVILHSGKPTPEEVARAVNEIHAILTWYTTLKELHITVDVAGYDDNEWYQGEGQYLAEYVTSLLHVIMPTTRGSSQPAERLQQPTYSTEIRLTLQADDWEATEGAVEITSEMVREAIDESARQYNGQLEVTTRNVGATVKTDRMRITDVLTVSVDISIGLLQISHAPRLTGRYVEGTDRRDRALQALKQHMERDEREEA